MHVVVTGAGGFVGRSLVRELLRRGHEVTGVDVCESPGDAQNWVWLDPNVSLNSASLPRAADVVLHLAQSPAYRQGEAGEPAVFSTNVALLADFLRWAAGAGVTAFVTASTGTVYEPFEGEQRETDAVRPIGYYGASKLAAEVIADAYRDRFRVAHMRLYFVYGPHQRDMLIARLVDSIIAGREVGLPETGEGLVFVPTYVDDVARVFADAAESENWEGPINVASPEVVSFKALLETISIATNNPLVLKRAGEPPARPIVPNLDKLSSLTDLEAFTSLKDGIAATVKAAKATAGGA